MLLTFSPQAVSCRCLSESARETIPSVESSAANSSEVACGLSLNDSICSTDSGVTTPSVVNNELTVSAPVQPASLSMNSADVTDILSPDGSVCSSDSGIFSGSSSVSGD